MLHHFSHDAHYSLFLCSTLDIITQVARAASELEVTVSTYKSHQDLEQQLEAARTYLKEEAAGDPDMAGVCGAHHCHVAIICVLITLACGLLRRLGVEMERGGSS